MTDVWTAYILTPFDKGLGIRSARACYGHIVEVQEMLWENNDWTGGIRGKWRSMGLVGPVLSGARFCFAFSNTFSV